MTLADVAWGDPAIPPSLRRSMLSWSVHVSAAVSALAMGCGSAGSATAPGSGSPPDAFTSDDRALAPDDGSAMDAPPEEDARSLLTGTVLDFDDLRPLAARAVWIGGDRATTDESGHFTMSGVPSVYDAIV